jgi:heavy metal translocating P-type ATPase
VTRSGQRHILTAVIAKSTVRESESSSRSDVRTIEASSVVAPSLLAVSGGCLGLGAILHLAGAGSAGDVVWIVGGAVGAAYSLWTLIDGLRRGRLGVDVIAVLALVGALAVAEYLAAAVISLMVASGRALESWAAGRARHDLQSLLDRAPRSARRYEGETLTVIAVDEAAVGDRLLVGSGELVPVDGVLLQDAVLDESALTGESLPIERAGGEPARSGVVNAGSPFDLRATSNASESTYAGIVRLVSEAEGSQAPFVRLADRYAVWFLALTLGVAAAAWAAGGAARAVAVLVVATPCPLILAAPVALVAGLSRAARRGVIIKGGAVLERLAGCTTLLVDKTGTLTSGRPALAFIVSALPERSEDILRMAASLDQVSLHVLANAVVQAATDRKCELALPEAVEEVAGQGIRGLVDDHEVAVGKAAWVGMVGAPAWAKAVRRRARLDGSLTVFVSIDGVPAGALVLDDPVRPDAARTIRSLRRSGIERIVMVTGDRVEVAETVGAIIGVDEVLAERSPSEKLEAVSNEHRRAPTIMVGDGINDAPALAVADVGVAMGARGASASSEAADVVLTVDRLDRVGEARAIAHHSRRVALESVVAGMAMSLGAMAAAALGFLPAVWGALLQEGIDVLVIVNALRALRPPGTDLRLAEEDSILAERFRAEHLSIRADIERIRLAADSLGVIDPGESMAHVRQVHRLLVEEVGPHEEAEEEVLYPALARLLGGSDPVGPMSRAHVEIAHQIRRLGQLLDDIGPEGPDGEDVAELRALLYGLYAVLRLHTTQEEESYLSLGEELEAREDRTRG